MSEKSALRASDKNSVEVHDERMGEIGKVVVIEVTSKWPDT
jgi:hypothetical protein